MRYATAPTNVIITNVETGYSRGGSRRGAQAPPPQSAKTTYIFQWTFGWIASFSTPLKPRKLDLTH